MAYHYYLLRSASVKRTGSVPEERASGKPGVLRRNIRTPSD